MLPTKINERDIYSSILPIYNERTCQRCHGSKEDIRAILHVEVSRIRTLSKMKSLRYQIALLTLIVFLVSLYLLYRFSLKSLIMPIIRTTETLKRHSKIASHEGMDELQLMILHTNDLIRYGESLAKEITVLQSTNNELSGEIEVMKIKVREYIVRPLLKVTASIEAFSEEIKNDSQREILRNIISELSKLSRISEDLK